MWLWSAYQAVESWSATTHASAAPVRVWMMGVGKWVAACGFSLALSFESYWLMATMEQQIPSVSPDQMDFWKWGVGQSGLFLALLITLYLLFYVIKLWIASERKNADAERARFDAERARFENLAKLFETGIAAIQSNRDSNAQIMTLVSELRIQLAARDQEHRDSLDRRQPRR